MYNFHSPRWSFRSPACSNLVWNYNAQTTSVSFYFWWREPLVMERKDLWMPLSYSSWEPLQRPVKHTTMFFQSYNPTLGTNFIITVRKYQTKITFKEEFTCAHSLRRHSLSWFKRHNACGLHFARSRKRWMLVLNMSSIFSFIWIINWMFRIPVHGMVPSHSGAFLLIVSKNIITDIPKGVPHPIPPVLLNSSCN